MPDINKSIKDISSLKKKVMGDLLTLCSMLSKTSSEVDARFRGEFQRQEGKLAGLEDFNVLNRILKKNAMLAKNAQMLLQKMRSTTGYDVSEDEAPVDKEIQEIFEE